MCAAENGHLTTLQWLRSQDPPCPWDEDACLYAAMSGHLTTLQWLRSQDPPCPWDKARCLAEAESDWAEYPADEATAAWIREQPE